MVRRLNIFGFLWDLQRVINCRLVEFNSHDYRLTNDLPPIMSSLDTPGLEEESNTIPLHDPNYDYYSIDNILEEDVLLKVKPKYTILVAECLRESDDKGNISTNTELELPAWIAIPLVRDHCVELLEPVPFRQKYL